MDSKKVVIIGGVAAGASAAARMRRLDERAQITVFERGGHVSYANCGLPYHIGGVIEKRQSLLVTTPEKFKSWYNIDVRTLSAVTSIDRANKLVHVSSQGGEYDYPYDYLVIATGSSAYTPKVEGDDNPRVGHLWTIADMDRIAKFLQSGAKEAVIVGAGFIALEAAENLRRIGVGVTLVQRSNRVLPIIDDEMSIPVRTQLSALGVKLKLGCEVVRYEAVSDGVGVVLSNGEVLHSDIVLTGTGVRPNSELALNAGLKCSAEGYIVVDEHMRTSDPYIYAAGDVVEVAEPIFGGRTHIPLAGPANKQGRIAADNIAGFDRKYRGTFGASIVKIGSVNVGSVGFTERRLKIAGKPYKKLYLHPSSSAAYYPAATRMDLKLLFGDDGTIYGAQIVGESGVDKRIDTIASAMQSSLKADELADLELSYAPPFNSAKDPVNFAGFVASNILGGITDHVYADEVPSDAFLLDVREPGEVDAGGVSGAVNIPLGSLRSRLSELPKDRLIVAMCRVGMRGYLAERILKQNGFKAANLSGGYLTVQAFKSLSK